MIDYDDGRFFSAYQYTKVFGPSGGYTRILVDKTTKVQYLLHSWGESAGMTVLIDQDGKPLLYKPED